MIKECMICHRFFWNPDGFYRCWICLKKDRDWNLTKGDENLDAMMTAFDQLHREHEQLKNNPPQKVVKKVLRLDTLAKNRVKTLLKLCHPDKHASRLEESAKEITAWLLEIRKKMK